MLLREWMSSSRRSTPGRSSSEASGSRPDGDVEHRTSPAAQGRGEETAEAAPAPDASGADADAATAAAGDGSSQQPVASPRYSPRYVASPPRQERQVLQTTVPLLPLQQARQLQMQASVPQLVQVQHFSQVQALQAQQPPQQLAHALQVEQARSAQLDEDLRATRAALAQAEVAAHEHTMRSQLAQDQSFQLQAALTEERARREKAEGDLHLARAMCQELQRRLHEPEQPLLTPRNAPSSPMPSTRRAHGLSPVQEDSMKEFLQSLPQRVEALEQKSAKKDKDKDKNRRSIIDKDREICELQEMLAQEMLSRQQLIQGQEVISKNPSTSSLGPVLRRMSSSTSCLGHPVGSMSSLFAQTPEPEAEDLMVQDLMVSRQRSCDSIHQSPRLRDRELDRSATRMYSSPCLSAQKVLDAQSLQDTLENKIFWKQTVDRAMRPTTPLLGEDNLVRSGLCHSRKVVAGAGSVPLSSCSSPQLSARGPGRDMHAHTPSMRMPAAVPGAVGRAHQGPPTAALVAASPRPVGRRPAAGESFIVVGSSSPRLSMRQPPQPVATAPGGFPFARQVSAGRAGRTTYAVVYPDSVSPPVPA